MLPILSLVAPLIKVGSVATLKRVATQAAVTAVTTAVVKDIYGRAKANNSKARRRAELERELAALDED